MCFATRRGTCHGTSSWVSMACHIYGIPRHVAACHGTPWDMPWNLMIYHDTPWHVPREAATCRDMPRYPVTCRDRCSVYREKSCSVTAFSMVKLPAACRDISWYAAVVSPWHAPVSPREIARNFPFSVALKNPMCPKYNMYLVFSPDTLYILQPTLR